MFSRVEWWGYNRGASPKGFPKYRRLTHPTHHSLYAFRKAMVVGCQHGFAVIYRGILHLLGDKL